MSKWLFNNKALNTNELIGYKSFVYVITNMKNGKKYFGKKRLQFISRKKIKNSNYRRKVVKTSDWEEYWGSSKALAIDIEKYGKENFKREIIRLCSRLSEASYHEAKLQFENDVILKPDLFYNEYVGCRISRNQMGVSSL